MSDTIGSLVIDLVANTAQFTSQLQKMGAEVKETTESIKKTLEGIGFLVIIDQIKDAIEESTKFGDEIAKSAAKTGVGVTAISELAFAAKQVGIALPDVTTALEKMGKAISEAASGTGTSKQAFDALGITINQLKQLSPEKQFEEIAEQINKLPTPADKARAAIELFGRAGAELLPLFEQGAAGIEEARQKAVAFGASLDQDQVKKLKEANDAITDLKSSFFALATTLTAAVAPALKTFFDSITNAATGNKTALITDQIRRLQEQLDYVKASPGGGGPQAALIQAQINAAQNALQGLQLAKQIKDDLSSAATSSGGTPGAAPGFLPEIQPITINPNLKINLDATTKFYDDLNKATQTGSEKVEDSIAQFQAQIEVLLESGQVKIGDEFSDAEVRAVGMTRTAIEGAITQADAFSRSRADENSAAVAGFYETNAAAIELSYQGMTRQIAQDFAAQTASAKASSENQREEFQQTAAEAKAVSQAIQNSFAQAFDNIGKGGLKGLVKDFIDAFRKIVDQAAAIDLAKLLGITAAFKNQGSGSALGSIFSGIGALFGGGGSGADAAAAAEGPAFATGGSFKVGGGGGVDSQLVRFRASPDETVTITRPGQAAAGAVHFSPVYNVGSGVSRSDVISACAATQTATIGQITRLIRGGAFGT